MPATLPRREGGSSFLLRGTAERERQPGAHHVLARVFKDMFPRYKTMRGSGAAQSRLGPTGSPSSSRSSVSSGSARSARSSAYGIAEFNERCRQSVFSRRGMEPADRADRLLDRPRGRLRHLRPSTSSRSGGPSADLGRGPALPGPPGGALLPALRHVTVEPRGRAATTTSRPSIYVRFPVLVRARSATGSSLIWTTTPWTLVRTPRRSRSRRCVRPRAPRRNVYVLAATRRRILGEGQRSSTLPRPRSRGHGVRARPSVHQRPRHTTSAATRC